MGSPGTWVLPRNPPGIHPESNESAVAFQPHRKDFGTHVPRAHLWDPMGFEAIAGDPHRLGARVDPDRRATERPRCDQGGPAAAARIEHEIARPRVRADESLEERERLLGRVP